MQKKVTITRRKWVRGGKKGDPRLLNKQGNMCCLGFACNQLEDIPMADLKYEYYPKNIKNTKDKKNLLWIKNKHHSGTIYTTNTELSIQGAHINDLQGITEIEREYRLKDLFADHDIKLVFK